MPDIGQPAAPALLRMQSIVKRFPGVVAVDRVDLELMQGEILGLIGENGAGKSTLIRILGGIFPADGGEISIDNHPAQIHSVQDALSYGVSIIHQELNLAGNLDIAANIFLGREPSFRCFGIMRRRELYREAEKLARQVGISHPMTTLVDELSVGESQLVEITKALSMSARILVLDEPTSSLSPGEADRLFDVMRQLRSSGVSMVYISHRLAEVQRICDRVVVLRDGRRVGELKREQIDRDAMVRLMVGRDISRFFPEAGHPDRSRSPVLSVVDVRRRGSPFTYSFDVHPGEILGFAGLVGAGRTELMRTLFGVDPAVSGRISVDGRPVRIRSPRDALRSGIGLVPEDRQGLGVILQMALRENLTLPGLETYHPFLLKRRRELEVASRQVMALSIKTSGLEQEVQYLSGGTQQKVALGKWLALSPKVLILDEPTRGIDVGSKSEIYRLIRELADSGVGIVMISSDMEEIIGLSDRVVVMHEGRIAGETSRREMTEDRIMRLATGGETL